jgi:uroporphyrin-III C-methyltransferase
MTSFAQGSVVFIGAGPGAADLVTVRGLRLLREAEVVIHDALPGDSLLVEVAPGALCIPVGKRCGSHSATQAEINAHISQQALAGKRVVRLKGGDPGIFGRLGEEIAHLQELGIPWSIVPGVTASVASAAAAGFPLTHRGVTMAVTFLTGHCASGKQADLRPFVATGATLCLYMGAKHLIRSAVDLLAAGQSGATPVALVSKASQPGESILLVELHELASGQVDTESLPTPLMAVVGEVVRQPGWRASLG